MDRRGFLARAAGGLLTAAGSGIRAVFAAEPGRAVAVRARIGTVFPPISLAARLRRSTRSYEIVRSDEAGGDLHLVIFSNAAPVDGTGLLNERDVASIRDRVSGIVAREAGLRVAALEVERMPGFWYPFSERPAVCCRLKVMAA